MSIIGDLSYSVLQRIARDPGRAIPLSDIGQGEEFNRVPQCIAHRAAQQAAAVSV